MSGGAIFGGLFQGGSYLGPGYNPFNLDGDPSGDMKVRNLEPPRGLTLDRLEDRRYLLARLDTIDRRRDLSGTMDGLDQFTAQAYEMVTGPAARQALDLSREDPRLRDRYGRTRIGQSCLLARRLVEAGVTFVTIAEGNWDHHADRRPVVPPAGPAARRRRRRRWSRTSTTAAWPTACWWSSGASSAGPPGSTARAVATTGRAA